MLRLLQVKGEMRNIGKLCLATDRTIKYLTLLAAAYNDLLKVFIYLQWVLQFRKIRHSFTSRLNVEVRIQIGPHNQHTALSEVLHIVLQKIGVDHNLTWIRIGSQCGLIDWVLLLTLNFLTSGGSAWDSSKKAHEAHKL
jgi:hypothetical protein